MQLVGRARKYKGEMDFLKGLVETISTSGAFSSQDVIESLKARITVLQTGISEEALGPQDDVKTSDASRLSAHREELKLPSLEEHDASRSVVTIDDVAWGRQSKTLHAENKNDVSLPPLSSLLPLASINPRELPKESQARVLVRFHLESLSFFHNSLHGPSFLDECEQYWSTGRPRHPLWLAVYLAVLSVSAWSLPVEQAQICFPGIRTRSLSATWYSAMLSVLYANNFIERHSICALQAIVISNLVVYVLGHSDLQTVLVATAIRIAQCMGLDKQVEDETYAVNGLDAGVGQWHEKIRRQLVRRIWWQLITQDYFEIAFSNRCIVPLEQFSTPMPTNCEDEDLNERVPSEPTVSSYSIAVARLACLMPSLARDVSYSEPHQPGRQYQRVLEVDLQMRDLVSTLPSFLKRGEPHQPHWPPWVHWARSTLTCSAADKIIMIHRPFLMKSFKDPLYTYTRVTCLSAALTILKEYERIKDTDVSSIWVVPAFTISGAIVVMLDLLHKTDLDIADLSRKDLVLSALAGLEQDHGNYMAERGVRLLRALLRKEEVFRASQQTTLQQQREARNDSAIWSNPCSADFVDDFATEGIEAWFSGNNIPSFPNARSENPALDSLSHSFAFTS